VDTGDRRPETGDRRQETGDRRQETGDRRGDRKSPFRFVVVLDLATEVTLEALSRGTMLGASVISETVLITPAVLSRLEESAKSD
jgi:hypothetical protein